jgi:hypothetical protein
VLAIPPPILRRVPALLALAGLGLAACGSTTPPTTTRGRTATRPAKASAPAPARPAAPAALTYRPLYTMAAAVQDPGTAALGGDRFVLMGGITPAVTSTDAVVIGTPSGSHQVAALPNPQHDAEAARLGSRVYLFGGGQFTEYDHILSFDPATATVATAGTLPQAESDVAVTGDGQTAYIVGGYNGTDALDTVLAFTPGASPRVVAHLPTALRYAAVTMAGGAIIVAGGSMPTGDASQAIYRVTPATGQVREIGRLPAPLTHAGAATLGGFVYLIGGRGGSTTSQTAGVLAVNPLTGAVRAVGQLPTPLSDAGVTAVGDAIIVAGGHGPNGTVASVGELVPAG